MIGKTNDLPFNPLDFQALPHDFTSDYNLGIHTAETTQRYALGTRYMTWDGRIYKYYHALAATRAGNGAKNTYAQALGWSAVASATPVGESYVNVTTGATQPGTDNANTSIFAKDGLEGGYVCIFDGGTIVSGIRGITANDAVATGGGTLKIYIDRPVNLALTTFDVVEIMASPYKNLLWASSAMGPTIVVPVIVATAGQYSWGQTWGPIWCPPQATAGDNDAAGEENFHLIFRADGSVESHNHASAVGGTGYNYHQQHAGFVLGCNATKGQAAPFFMLQISV